MANHDSSKKRIRQTATRRLRNRYYAKTVLGILEDYPLGRVIPDLFLALERWLAGLEIDSMAQVVNTFQNSGNGFV